MPHSSFDDDDEMGKESEGGKPITDFDCPVCNANNPTESAVRDAAELLCNYCGTGFRAKVGSNGKLRLREM